MGSGSKGTCSGRRHRALTERVFAAARSGGDVGDRRGVLPGSGRRLVTEDGREITGYLASDLDENSSILCPTRAPRGVKRLILRRERLRTVDLWQHGS